MRATRVIAAAIVLLALLAPGAVADREAAEVTTLEREAHLDAPTALAALAVSARTGEAVGYGDLASGTVVRAHATEAVEERVGLDIADLNVENVFSALALGLVHTGPESDLEALAATANLTQESSEVVVTSRLVELPPRQAIFAIALAGAGGELALADVLQVEQSVVDAATAGQTVRIGTGNALLALALGHGVTEPAGGGDPTAGGR